jgi:hypothetical protein
MPRNLLLILSVVILSSGCVSSSHNKDSYNSTVSSTPSEVDIPAGLVPDSLTKLPQTEDGGFVLAPGYYETELKTYCLQPGTPDPSPRDAYLQAPLSGYRKDIVQTALYSSRRRPDINQRNVQLLLWSVVSGSDFNKLPGAVQSDAKQLLTSKQVFELKGGVVGFVKTVSGNLPGGVLKGHNDVKRLFELGSSSYEAFEKIAVLREPSKIKRADFKNDQWYKQPDGYYVRYFPISYQKIKVQVYVPDTIADSTGRSGEEYIVFDPTGLQIVPANSNAQRLGIGGPVFDVIRKVIRINKNSNPPRPVPNNKKENKDGKGTT